MWLYAESLMCQSVVSVQHLSSKVDEFAAYNQMSFFDAAKMADEIPGLAGRSAEKIKSFADQILVYRSKLPYVGISGLFDEIIEDTGYVRELEAEQTPEAESRIENIDELKNKIISYEEENEQDGSNHHRLNFCQKYLL